MGLTCYWAAEKRSDGWWVGWGPGLPDDPFAWPRSRAHPALGAWTLDSDLAYIVAAAESTSVAELVTSPEMAMEYELPAPTGGEAAFAEWTRFTPRHLTDKTVREILSAEHVFAEETVAEFSEALGLEFPEPDVDRDG